MSEYINILTVYAIIHDHVYLFIDLIKSGNININYVLKNNREFIDFLDKNAREKKSLFEGGTPIIYIAIQFGRLRILNLLIKNGAQTFFPYYWGSSLLTYATEFNQTEICEYLIENNFHLDKFIHLDCLIKISQENKNNTLVELFTKLRNDPKLMKMLYLITKWTECMNECIYQIKDPIGYKRQQKDMCRREF